MGATLFFFVHKSIKLLGKIGIIPEFESSKTKILKGKVTSKSWKVSVTNHDSQLLLSIIKVLFMIKYNYGKNPF